MKLASILVLTIGVSGASRLMVSHRLRSISSVLGGKNSKEILGEWSVRWPSKAADVISVMALHKAPKGWADIRPSGEELK